MRIISALIFLLICSSTLAQTAIWPTSNATWRVERNLTGGFVIPDEEDPTSGEYVSGIVTTQIYYHLGETNMIDELEYTQLLQHYESTFESANGEIEINTPLTETPEIRGLFRLEEEKVFFLDATTSEEFLLYDFGLEVGDEIPSSFIHTNSNTITVSAIDTLFLDGSPHRRYSLQGDGVYYDKIIEGIGNINGPIQHLGIGFDSSHELLCFAMDGFPLYPNTNSDCFGSTTLIVEDPVKDSEIVVYPNPAKNQFKILNKSQTQFSSISIYDGLGKEVVRIDNPNVSNTIQRNQLPNGIYSIVCNMTKGKVINRKVILFD